MRVETKSGAVAAAGTVRRRGAATGTFTIQGGDEAARPSAAAAATSLVGIDALLALQAQDDGTDRRRRALKRGHDLLDALDRLKAALLFGQGPCVQGQGPSVQGLCGQSTTDALARLAAALAIHAAPTGDAGLDEVLAHVELRARVEMAKLAGA